MFTALSFLTGCKDHLPQASASMAFRPSCHDRRYILKIRTKIKLSFLQLFFESRFLTQPQCKETVKSGISAAVLGCVWITRLWKDFHTKLRRQDVPLEDLGTTERLGRDDVVQEGRVSTKACADGRPRSRTTWQRRLQRPSGGVRRAYSLKAELLESLRLPSKWIRMCLGMPQLLSCICYRLRFRWRKTSYSVSGGNFHGGAQIDVFSISAWLKDSALVNDPKSVINASFFSMCNAITGLVTLPVSGWVGVAFIQAPRKH